ncbi:hypothetical protein [Achromobacter sp. Marseille-Q4962]|uniref:hypothetical protein n=1 Tax=Achromobacter sp. Marseille-Q4962 TaxID=2942202 RepID=UPI002074429C|nr:hypothetical protein [Achromobacter sp. Marseille-Q4962]
MRDLVQLRPEGLYCPAGDFQSISGGRCVRPCLPTATAITPAPAWSAVTPAPKDCRFCGGGWASRITARTAMASRSSAALRFPRILRWRRDKRARDADRLEALKRLAR